MSATVTIPQLDKPNGAAWAKWGGSVRVRCPECSQWAELDHTIDPDGTVHPSLECPTEGCTWHVFAKLDGWKR